MGRRGLGAKLLQKLGACVLLDTTFTLVSSPHATAWCVMLKLPACVCILHNANVMMLCNRTVLELQIIFRAAVGDA